MNLNITKKFNNLNEITQRIIALIIGLFIAILFVVFFYPEFPQDFLNVILPAIGILILITTPIIAINKANKRDRIKNMDANNLKWELSRKVNKKLTERLDSEEIKQKRKLLLSDNFIDIIVDDILDNLLIQEDKFKKKS